MDKETREILLYFFSPETLDALENECDYSFREHGFVKTYDWRIIDWIDNLLANADQIPGLTDRYGPNPKRAVRRMIDDLLTELEKIGIEEAELKICHVDFLNSWNFSPNRFNDPNDLIKDWLEKYDVEDIRDALLEVFQDVSDIVRMMDEYTEIRALSDEQT